MNRIYAFTLRIKLQLQETEVGLANCVPLGDSTYTGEALREVWLCSEATGSVASLLTISVGVVPRPALQPGSRTMEPG